MEQLENIASRLEKAAEETASLAAESRIKFDAMIEMQNNMQERFLKEKQDLLAHFESSDKRKNKIIIGLIVVILLLVGSFVGGAVYLLANFDVAVVSTQDVYSDNNSSATINDGINLTSQQ